MRHTITAIIVAVIMAVGTQAFAFTKYERVIIEQKTHSVCTYIEIFTSETTYNGRGTIEFNNLIRKFNTFMRKCEFTFHTDKALGSKIAADTYGVVFGKFWGMDSRLIYNDEASPLIADKCTDYTINELYNGLIFTLTKIAYDGNDNGTRSLNSVRCLITFRIMDELRNRAIGAPEVIDPEWLN